MGLFEWVSCDWDWQHFSILLRRLEHAILLE